MSKDSMTIDELYALLKQLEGNEFRHLGGENRMGILYPAKYIDLTIDTRDMQCFSFRVRPWFNNATVVFNRTERGDKDYAGFVREYFEKEKAECDEVES